MAANFLNTGFPIKIDLSGEDYFYLMLEENIERYKCGHNIVRLVLFFDEEKDFSPFLQEIRDSELIYYLCNLQLNTGNLFQKPHWKFQNRARQIAIQTHRIATEEIPKELLNQNMDVYADVLLAFDEFVFPSGKRALVFSWHHILFDGKGASLLLHLLAGGNKLTKEQVQMIFPKKKVAPSFFKHITNLFEVKRFIEKNNKNLHSAFVGKAKKKEGNFSNFSIDFSPEESAKMKELAFQKGSKFGVNPYLLACSAQVVSILSGKRGGKGNFWIPVPYDGRKRGSVGPVITNTISFIFYRIDEQDLDSTEKIIQSLNQQMKEQVHNNLPNKFALLLATMRFFPLWLYRFLVNSSSSSNLATFLYSSSGDNNWDMNDIPGLDFCKVQLIPPFTFPPGITFSSSQFSSQFTINLSLAESVVDRSEQAFLLNQIKKIFLQEFERA